MINYIEIRRKSNGQLHRDIVIITGSKPLILHILLILKSRRLGECVIDDVNGCFEGTNAVQRSANFAELMMTLEK